MYGGMTWKEELILLTKFHENNLGLATDKVDQNEGEIIKQAVDDALAPISDGKARSIGRRNEMSI